MLLLEQRTNCKNVLASLEFEIKEFSIFVSDYNTKEAAGKEIASVLCSGKTNF